MEPEPERCPFCNSPADRIVVKNALCYARWDIYPVSRGHLLIMPFRHVPDFFIPPLSLHPSLFPYHQH